MIYIILLILSFLLTYFIKNYAIKKSLVAQVTDRSSHTVPTPHGGGIAIAVTWFLGLGYLFVEYNSLKETNYLLSNPKNKERLLSSLKHAREGKVKGKELIES